MNASVPEPGSQPLDASNVVSAKQPTSAQTQPQPHMQPQSQSSSQPISQRSAEELSALHYREQDSKQTLAEGLAEYYAKMPNLLPPEELSPESQELFIPHDACHVVFGCDTTVHDEALVDTWTMFGSDVGIKRYMAYLKNPDAKQIFDDAGWGKMLWLSLKALPDLIRVIWRARRMKARWPWEHHTLYMHRPLADIRKEFGITVIAHRG